MTDAGLSLYFYREGVDFTLPEEFPSLPKIPLLARTDEANRCLDGLYATVDRPEDADYIVFPYDLSPVLFRLRTLVAHFFIKTLPLFREYESRHVFLASHDRGQPLCTDAVIFTRDPRRSNADDGSVLTLPHFPKRHVLDKAPELEFSKLRYDVCFIGAQSDPVRARAIASIAKRKDIRYFFHYPNTTDWADKQTSYLHMEDEKKKREMEMVYVNNMRKSWAVLCPRGMGSSSVRFYETLCMGRIPVHISDEYVFPFADEIDYSRFCIDIPESAVDVVGEVLAQWFRKKTPEDLERMCREARATWERYFRPEDAKRIMVEQLRRHKAAPGPVQADKYVALPDERGRGERTGYAPGFFDRLEIDNKQTWFNRKLKIGKSPLDPSGVMNECNGVSCYLAPQDIRFLMEIGRQAPPNAAILEIGSWMGGSSIALANGLMASRNLGGVIYAVDTWMGSSEHQKFDFIQDDAMYEMFLDNIRKNLAHLFVRPVRAPSLEAAGQFRDGGLDVVFIDGDHSYTCCLEDLEAWYPKVKPGGLVLGHDYWPQTNNGVCRAAREFAGRHGVTLLEPPDLRFFVFRKP
ncbi:MAG: class I SAM-dependent methyltransferase [Desulfovibrionaceae bacterium]